MREYLAGFVDQYDRGTGNTGLLVGACIVDYAAQLGCRLGSDRHVGAIQRNVRFEWGLINCYGTVCGIPSEAIYLYC